MKDLINVKMESIPAKVSVNFEEIKADLKETLKHYDGILVTEDTLSDDKKLAAEINKKAGEFKRVRIDESKKLNAPVAVFESQMKELEGLCLDVRAKIKDQVDVFEYAKLKKFRILIIDELYLKRDENNIAEEFHLVHAIDSLVKLTAMTKSGALTKSTIQSVNDFVDKENTLQDKINKRLSDLETYSLKAGLDSALVRENISGFLFYDDTYDYLDKLNSLIESELTRQEQARKKQLEIAEAAVKEKDLSDTGYQEQAEYLGPPPGHPALTRNTDISFRADENPYPSTHCPEKSPSHPTPKGRVQVQQSNPGRVEVTVLATFKVSVPSGVAHSKITTRLEKLLSDAGITSLEKIEVTHVAA